MVMILGQTTGNNSPTLDSNTDCIPHGAYIGLLINFGLTCFCGFCGIIYYIIIYQTTTLENKQRDAVNKQSEVNEASLTPSMGDPSMVIKMKHAAWEISYRELKFGKIIGRGNIGVVYEGYWRGSKVAIKTLLGNWLTDEDMIERFRIEITLMSTLQHPNVLMFMCAVIDRQSNNPIDRSNEPAGTKRAPMKVQSIALVTEFCEYGSLYDFLHSEKKMNWKMRLNMAIDIARGMHYLHCRAGVIQRDLKSANVLVNGQYVLKIADFGLSRRTSSSVNMETYCGTPANMAPEIVRQEKYSVKADVFSYSIILWELLTREDPYPGKSGLALAYAVANDGLRPLMPSYCPEEFANLIESCWHPIQENRPDFEKVLDFLQDIDKQVRDIVTNKKGPHLPPSKDSPSSPSKSITSPTSPKGNDNLRGSLRKLTESPSRKILKQGGNPNGSGNEETVNQTATFTEFQKKVHRKNMDRLIRTGPRTSYTSPTSPSESTPLRSPVHLVEMPKGGKFVEKPITPSTNVLIAEGVLEGGESKDEHSEIHSEIKNAAKLPKNIRSKSLNPKMAEVLMGNISGPKNLNSLNPTSAFLSPSTAMNTSAFSTINKQVGEETKEGKLQLPLSFKMNPTVLRTAQTSDPLFNNNNSNGKKTTNI